ncbi:glycoside hydrolase [Butyrivibrio sp. VCB2006]|uniref:glycoside hydrolase n=1 Tax=Butyrivibrio sp. VCB2006 TaxID=1280679 RepID=UPI00040051E3|nr:glycoside hydrolase [Butyrivibrio sp. VCB2006]
MRNSIGKHKLSAGLFAAVLALSQLTGCGAAAGTDDAAGQSNQEEVASADTSANEAASNGEDGDNVSIEEMVADMDISRTIKLDTSNIQTFNDTDGDGYGEFQGFGTSLCWWANRCGYSEKLTEASAEAFYNKETGLGMTIGRYNVGGGDNVTTEDVTAQMKEESPFLHKEHIRRSDSVVPGYCVDVTKIDLSKNNKDYYESSFTRVDYDCGFAWNYDWDADKNQMNILIAAAKSAGDEFIGEAFSNSPPYFMTVSGCTSGGEDPSVDNLREDSVTAFACYMADVIEHWAKEGVINFQSVDPMNEPATSYWKMWSEKQEGCHFTQGESQSRILVELNKELQNKGIDIIICASDETSIDAAIISYKHLTPEAKEAVTRIDTHSYQGTQREMLRQTAQEAGVNLWMSEVDGTYSIGKKATGMSAALGFSEAIMEDLNGLMPSAWIMWDAVDLHVDTNNKYDTCTRQEADKIIEEGTPFWGIAIADHDKEELLLSKKYYAFGQFSRYIRPGYTLVGSSSTTVAAVNRQEKSAVIVAMNTNSDDLKWEFDLSELGLEFGSVTAIRTSKDENWADVTDDSGIAFEGNKFTSLVKGSSITTFIIK